MSRGLGALLEAAEDGFRAISWGLRPLPPEEVASRDPMWLRGGWTLGPGDLGSP